MAAPPAMLMGEGIKTQARVELNSATRSLIRALNLLKEVESDEARAILQALKALERVTPDVDESVSRSEIEAQLASAKTAPPGGPMGGAGALGPAGPAGPRPQAVAGMPFSANQSVPGPMPG